MKKTHEEELEKTLENVVRHSHIPISDEELTKSNDKKQTPKRWQANFGKSIEE